MKNLHIVSGKSAAGTLNFVFKEQKNSNDNTVYCFNDFLSIGPLSDLTTPKGIEERSQYLFNMINKAFNEELSIKEIQNDIKHLYNYSFSDYDRIIVWYGENASEKLLKLLCCKLVNQSQLYKVNVSTEYLDGYALQAVGECSPENMEKLLSCIKKISLEEKKQHTEEWNRITQSKALLRIYDSGKIKNANEFYFDRLILKKCTDDYTLMFKVAGEVMGSSEQVITDTFIIYRIFHLIKMKQLQYSGDLNIIRTLLVKK